MDEQTRTKLEKLVRKCDRCGACVQVCPLYKVDPRDRAASRGKIAITRAFLEGKLDGGDKALRHALDYCLLCKACTEVCPNKIMTDEAMIEMRDSLGEEHGLSPKYRLIGGFMGSNGLKKLASPAVSIAQHARLPRLTRYLLPKNAKTPPLDHKGPALFRQGKPGASDIDLSKVKRIAYFRGCAMKLFFKNASEASVNLLKKTGRTVEVPDVNCCGVPQQSHGLLDDARELARHNVDLLADYDLIVTDCGSCAATLREYGARYADDFTMRAKAAQVSGKVMSLSEYLSAVGYHPTPHEDLRVTYHASCHLNRGLGVMAQPEALLEEAVTYLPAAHKDMCCGGAGTFQVDFPEISNKVLRKKCEDFEATGADIVVAECPSCLMQLGKMEAMSGLRVMHISQVL